MLVYLYRSGESLKLTGAETDADNAGRLCFPAFLQPSPAGCQYLAFRQGWPGPVATGARWRPTTIAFAPGLYR